MIKDDNWRGVCPNVHVLLGRDERWKHIIQSKKQVRQIFFRQIQIVGCLQKLVCTALILFDTMDHFDRCQKVEILVKHLKDCLEFFNIAVYLFQEIYFPIESNVVVYRG